MTPPLPIYATFPGRLPGNETICMPTVSCSCYHPTAQQNHMSASEFRGSNDFWSITCFIDYFKTQCLWAIPTQILVNLESWMEAKSTFPTKPLLLSVPSAAAHQPFASSDAKLHPCRHRIVRARLLCIRFPAAFTAETGQLLTWELLWPAVSFGELVSYATLWRSRRFTNTQEIHRRKVFLFSVVENEFYCFYDEFRLRAALINKMLAGIPQILLGTDNNRRKCLFMFNVFKFVP